MQAGKPSRSAYQRVATLDVHSPDGGGDSNTDDGGNNAAGPPLLVETEARFAELFREDTAGPDYPLLTAWRAQQANSSASFSFTYAKLYLRHSFHVLDWLPRYDWSNDLLPDITAGVTVGVVCVAQGIAYGLLAGLPSYYGLYASLVPSLVYAAFVSLHSASNLKPPQ